MGAAPAALVLELMAPVVALIMLPPLVMVLMVVAPFISPALVPVDMAKLIGEVLEAPDAMTAAEVVAEEEDCAETRALRPATRKSVACMLTFGFEVLRLELSGDRHNKDLS